MRVLAAVLWTLLILALCSMPGDNLPDLDLVSADKLGHFVLFAGFGWLWSWGSPREYRRSAPFVIAAGLVFAVGTEIYQGLLPFERDPSTADAIANTLGLLSGVWLYGRSRRSGSQRT